MDMDYGIHKLSGTLQFFLACFSLIIFLKTSEAWLEAELELVRLSSWFLSYRQMGEIYKFT